LLPCEGVEETKPNKSFEVIKGKQLICTRRLEKGQFIFWMALAIEATLQINY